jgi:signal transduction histidine kinase
MSAAMDQTQRLRQLVDAGIALASELSLDELLQRIAQTAAAITGAQYAALGVIDREGRSLERFIPVGIEPDVQARIGALPTGRGILGALITEAAPLRLHDLAEDPRSVGLPPGHPPMRTFLGVPITLRGVAYGNLYLTEKAGGEDFTEEDEELVGLLATQAAVAIENARLHNASVRWIRQLELLREVSDSLARETELPAVLDVAVSLLRRLVPARRSLAILPEDGLLRVVAADGADSAAALRLTMPREASKGGKVMARRRSERVDSVLDDPESDQSFMRQLGSRAALLLPLVVSGEAIGLLAAHDALSPSGRFDESDLRLAEAFAGSVAAAVDLAGRVARDSVKGILQGQERERRRLARELHDETGQALTAILVGLRHVRNAGSTAELQRAAAELDELATDALENVRRLALELRPASLDDFGLSAALERLVESARERSERVVQLEVRLSRRLDDEIETTVYRVVQEALTNVVRHAEAPSASVVVVHQGSALTVVVEDDGRGFDVDGPTDRFGLVSMRERLAIVRGTLDIDSEPGRGTTLRASIPVS